MIKRRFTITLVSFVFLFGFVSIGYGSNWILNAPNNQLPSGLSQKVMQAGGTLLRTMDNMGIALARFSSKAEAKAMEAHGFTVLPDVTIKWIPDHRVEMSSENIGEDETYYAYQWHLPVIQADLAWGEGATGEGVRVAVLDSGIWYGHPDLYYNIDFVASTTFVPGTTDFYDDNGHGTHVAGIIAAADDEFGTIGVAPNATLIGVKVLDSEGSGAFSWIVDGIYHAANQNADIINMSLGGTIKALGDPPNYTAQEAWELILMVGKAILYAKSKGCLVVCSAGNDATNLDRNGDEIVLPAEAGGIAISATGPIGLQDFDNVASYTNYGRTAIFMAAPGGDFQLYPEDGWHLDMVFSTYPEGWAWMAGTSQAAPMVSGVAALVLGHDGPMSYLLLKLRLALTADDLGRWGFDKYYGWGRVNAYRAVTNTWF